METVIGALEGTPWWVWALLAYLIYVGWKRTKTRIIRHRRIYILPAIIFIIELESVIRLFDGSALRILLWIGGLLIGIAVGWLVIRPMKIRADKDRDLLEMPGSWSSMAALLIIFAVKYYFGFMQAVARERMAEPGWVDIQLAVTGALAGWLIGRAGCFLWKFWNEPHNELAG